MSFDGERRACMAAESGTLEPRSKRHAPVPSRQVDATEQNSVASVTAMPNRVAQAATDYFSIVRPTPPLARLSCTPFVFDTSSIVTPFGLLIAIAPVPAPAVTPVLSSV